MIGKQSLGTPHKSDGIAKVDPALAAVYYYRRSRDEHQNVL